MPLWVTNTHSVGITVLAMPSRIGPRRPKRLYLQEWRDFYGLNQTDLGLRFEPPVSKGTISKWENNEREPTIGVLQAYAEALDPSLDWTAFGTPPPEKNESLASVKAYASNLEAVAKSLRKRAN